MILRKVACHSASYNTHEHFTLIENEGNGREYPYTVKVMSYDNNNPNTNIQFKHFDTLSRASGWIDKWIDFWVSNGGTVTEK